MTIEMFLKYKNARQREMFYPYMGFPGEKIAVSQTNCYRTEMSLSLLSARKVQKNYYDLRKSSA
jgi:hypothetical protein